MNTSTVRTLGLTLAAALLCGGLAESSPTVTGATGLFLNPTADLGEERLELQLAYIPARNAAETTDWLSLAGRYRLDGRTEVHGALEAMRATNDREGFALGVKRQLCPETEDLPALAVGAYYDSILRETAAYAVSSVAGVSPVGGGPNGLRAHFGVRWDRFEGRRDESAATAFAGLEAQLGDGARGFLEVGTQHHDRVHAKTPWAAGVRWRLKPGSTLTAAFATPAYGFATDIVASVSLAWRPALH